MENPLLYVSEKWKKSSYDFKISFGVIFVAGLIVMSVGDLKANKLETQSLHNEEAEVKLIEAISLVTYNYKSGFVFNVFRVKVKV
jgi:hypothetical protein